MSLRAGKSHVAHGIRDEIHGFYRPVGTRARGGPLRDQVGRFALRRNRRSVSEFDAVAVRPMTCRFLGNSGIAVLPRLLCLWCLVVPVMLLKSMFFGMLMVGTLGGTYTAVMAVDVAVLVAFQAFYRPVLLWCQDNYEFQVAWDWMAYLLSLTFNILIYTYRLLNEMWNGFCPFLALFVDILFDLAEMLVMIWVNTPILQYSAMWLVQYVVLMTEAFLDGCIQVFEAFVQFAQDMTVGLTAVLVEQAKHDLRRGAYQDVQTDTLIPVGDVLLHVAVVISTLILRLQVAFLTTMMPLIYSFLRTILPLVFKYIPPGLEIIMAFVAILTSDAVARIFSYFLQALPILLQWLEVFVCTVVVYGGTAVCLLFYGVCVTLSFLLRYVIRPMACSGMAILAGCFRAYVYAGLHNEDCYSCGDYNTACGCHKHAQPMGGCSGSCDRTVVPFAQFAANASNLADIYVGRTSGADDTSDIGATSMGVTTKKTGTQYQSCDRATDPTCVSAGTTITTFDVTDPTVRRRRTLPPLTPPPVSGPTKAPTKAPTLAPTAVDTSRRRSTVTTIASTSEGMVSAGGVYTASPGIYADLAVAYDGASAIFRMGSMSFTNAAGLQCVGGVGCAASPIVALLSGFDSTPFSANATTIEPWRFAEWTTDFWMRVDLPAQSNLTRVQLQWLRVSGVLRGPSTLQITTDGSTGTYTYSCLGTSATRVDDIALSGSASYVRLNFSAACGVTTTHTSLFHLVAMTVWGFAAPTTVGALALKAHASLRVVNASSWDPCASGKPQRVMDQRREYPSLFWPTGANASVGIQLQLHDDAGARAATLTRVTVHLAATNSLDPSTVRFCTADVASWSAALTDPRCTAALADTDTDSTRGNTWPGAAGLFQRYTNLSDSDRALGIVPAAYWNATYAERDPWPVRGGHLVFLPNATAGVCVLWLGPQAMARARATTWETAQVDLGMHPVYDTGATWMAGIPAVLVNGTTADPARLDSVYCDADLDAAVAGITDPPPVGQVPYLSPFGSSSATRQWLGIVEIDLRGTAPGGRRADVHPREADMRAHIAAKDRAERSRTADHLYTPAQAMAHRGLHSFQHGRSDTVAGRQIQRRLAEAAPEHSQEHPFHPDLSRLPDPATEPDFDCVVYETNHSARMRCLVRTQRAIATTKLQAAGDAIQQRIMLRDMQIDRFLARPTGRELLGSGILDDVASPFVQGYNGAADGISKGSSSVWDQVKGKVNEVVQASLTAFEGAITAAMGCSYYCSDVYHCTDSTKLGQCIPALIQFMTVKMFQCSDNQSLYDCTIGALVNDMLDLVSGLLDYLLQLVDLVGTTTATILGLGDLLRILSCQACSLTSIVTGVLSDFLDDFQVTWCLAIQHAGAQQCSKWDMDSGGAVGAAIFGEALPAMLILFGLVQVLPALAEVLVAFAEVVFGVAMEVFVDLLHDGYVLFMWFFSAAGVLGAVETMLATVDPIVTGPNQQGDQSGFDFGVFTDASVWGTTEASGSDYDPGAIKPAGCYQAQNTTANCSVRLSSHAALVGGINAASGSAAAVVAAGVNAPMEFDLGGCGCVVAQPPCQTGAGTGNCKWTDSNASVARAAAAAAGDAQATDGHPTNTTSWPYCAGLNDRIVLPNTTGIYAADSSELSVVFVPSRRCYLRFRNRTVTGGGYNDLALQDVKKHATGQRNVASWPYKSFSNGSGDPTTAQQAKDARNQFPNDALNSPSLDSVFRRRAGRRLLDHAKFGVGALYHTRAEAQQAQQEMAAMLRSSNQTFAQAQAEALGGEIWELARHVRKAATVLRVPHWEPAADTLRHLNAHARRLLGFDSLNLDAVTCGFQQNPGYLPNTYPCAKHLWCAIPPTLDRDFRFEKGWLAWKSEFVEYTLCPEFESYADAYLFLLRSVAHTVRLGVMAANGQGVWPWRTVVDSFWSLAGFPDNEWPEVVRHGPVWGPTITVMCAGLNSAVYVLLGLAFMLVYFTSGVWHQAKLATMVIFDDYLCAELDQGLEYARRKQEREWANEDE